ncbi:MAG TPA: type II secretion system F family protein [Acidimicrobiales bacterium]|nr:type II secretion system F family protein [Acidimicrobiales bacterium]
MSLVPLVAVLLGVLLLVGSRALRRREAAKALAELLEVDTRRPSDPEAAPAPRPLVEGSVAVAGNLVKRLDAKGSLADALERARIPLRPGELVILTGAGALTMAAVLLAVTGRWVLPLVAMASSPLLVAAVVKRRVAKRRKRFETQLPGALSLIASSLTAGHTFLRAIQMMVDESEPPLSEEFSLVVAETRLGYPVIDAVQRMADRLAIRDLDWVVQAIRIQQTVGGKLADLLHTLADFIRARDEVRREVLVLTAEGRMSAYVLGAMAPFLFVAIQVLNPGYMEPMFQGWGLVTLGGAAASVLMGTVVILRMVKIKV